MSRDLSVYSEVKDPLVFVKQMGSAIAKSQFFSCANIEQGEVLAMECLARRVPPLTLAERYHLIHGKLSMKADTMLAELIRHGGTYKQIARTTEHASIKIKNSRDDEQTFSLTWEEALAEPFVYSGKESDVVAKLANGQTDRLKIKDKYATPRSRMQMLWARVVSDGVRAMCPEAIAGAYAPEEVSDFDGMPDETQQNGNGEVIDAEFEPVGSGFNVGPVTGSAENPTPTPETTASSNGDNGNSNASTNGNGEQHPTGPGGYATIEQQQRLSELFAAFGNKALVKKQKVLDVCGVTELHAIPHDTAAQVIAKLEQQVVGLGAANGESASSPTPETVPAGESRQPDSTTADVDGPCSQVQIDAIKKLINEVTQFEPDIAVKIKLAIKPLEKIAETTWGYAQSLQAKLEEKLRKHTVDKTLANGAGNAEEATATENEEETSGK